MLSEHTPAKPMNRNVSGRAKIAGQPAFTTEMRTT
jgi:hypothetical protein